MSEQNDLPIENWFWEVIEECRPNLTALEKKLEGISKEKLERYMVYYDIASAFICEPWEGPYIDEEIGTLSEDSTEDFTDWIVSQGRTLWEYATSPGKDFCKLFYLSVGEDSPAKDEETSPDFNIEHWSIDVSKEEYKGWQSPKLIARIIYEERFGIDYLEVQEELHEKYDDE